MERVIDDGSSRQRDYKYHGNDNEAQRGRRREGMVELRKQKRATSAFKRRDIHVDEDMDAELDTPSDIPALIACMREGELSAKHTAVMHCRALLSQSADPPIDAVVRGGAVPILVEMLYSTDEDIQTEAAWTLSSITAGTSEQTAEVVRNGAIPTFLNCMKSESQIIKERALLALGNIAGDGPALRDVLLGLGGIPCVVQVLNSEFSLSLLRRATWTLSNMCRFSNPPPATEHVEMVLPILTRLILESQDIEILSDTLWGLSYLASGPVERVQRIIDSNVCRNLIRFLKPDNDFKITEPALRIFGHILSGSNLHADYALNLGVTPLLRALLGSPKSSVVQDACWALSNIAAGPPHHIQCLIDTSVLPSIVQLLHTNHSSPAGNEAAWVVANLLSGGQQEQVVYAAHMGTIKSLIKPLSTMAYQDAEPFLKGVERGLQICMQSGMNLVDDMEDFPDVVERFLNAREEHVARRAQSILDTFFTSDEI
eukprot:m.11341 g.11341  ORF g.11341 m.11341 type:complete len:485 (+) comp4425_c0_seq1:166-1620(+)